MNPQDICERNWIWYVYSAEQGPLVSFITQANTVYAWFTLKKKDESSVTERDLEASKPQFVFGTYTAETMPPYTPYYDGGQAQAPELWAIPGTEYRDAWDPQTGRGIRRVKRYVFTGAETIVQGDDHMTSVYRYYIRSVVFPARYNATPGLCSHLQCGTIYTIDTQQCIFGAVNTYPYFYLDKTAYPDVESVRDWFTAQYAAGTPVTIWYPLIGTDEPFATPPAKLTMPTGYGQIIQVSGDVPDCPISAKYLTHS